jgi:hypothetical protein
MLFRKSIWVDDALLCAKPGQRLGIINRGAPCDTAPSARRANRRGSSITPRPRSSRSSSSRGSRSRCGRPAARSSSRRPRRCRGRRGGWIRGAAASSCFRLMRVGRRSSDTAHRRRRSTRMAARNRRYASELQRCPLRANTGPRQPDAIARRAAKLGGIQCREGGARKSTQTSDDAVLCQYACPSIRSLT